MSSQCLTTNVETFLEEGCPQFALTQNEEYFDSLFELFYGDRDTIYTEGEELFFQDLLAEISKREPIGKFTSQKWLNLCSDASFTSNRPDISRICGCFSRYRSCGSDCNSNSIPIFQRSGEFETCFQNICLIDGLQISLNRSSIGDIRIDQLCSFCRSPASCACRIENFEIDAISSTTGILSIQQNCNPNLTTITTPTGRNAKEVYSSLFDGRNGENENERETRNLTKALIFWILSFFLFFFLLLLFIFSFKDAYRNPEISLNKGKIKKDVEIPSTKNKE